MDGPKAAVSPPSLTSPPPSHHQPTIHTVQGCTAVRTSRVQALELPLICGVGVAAARNLQTGIALLGKIRERGIPAGSDRLHVQPYVLLGRRRSRHLALQVFLSAVVLRSLSMLVPAVLLNTLSGPSRGI